MSSQTHLEHQKNGPEKWTRPWKQISKYHLVSRHRTLRHCPKKNPEINIKISKKNPSLHATLIEQVTAHSPVVAHAVHGTQRFVYSQNVVRPLFPFYREENTERDQKTAWVTNHDQAYSPANCEIYEMHTSLHPLSRSYLQALPLFPSPLHGSLILIRSLLLCPTLISGPFSKTGRSNWSQCGISEGVLQDTPTVGCGQEPAFSFLRPGIKFRLRTPDAGVSPKILQCAMLFCSLLSPSRLQGNNQNLGPSLSGRWVLILHLNPPSPAPHHLRNLYLSIDLSNHSCICFYHVLDKKVIYFISYSRN